METRVAVISIIVENPEATEQLNQYLHESGKYIIGRMGIRTVKKESILSVLRLMHRRM
mgnify:FL=1